MECPICHKEKPMVEMDVCQKCSCALRHMESDLENPAALGTGVLPMIPQSVLEECSLAIATSSPDEVGCSASKKKKNKKKYYRSMHDWMEVMGELDGVSEDNSLPVDVNEATPCVRASTYVSFAVNFCLLVGKSIALGYSSSSYTLISSLADSALDLIAGLIISCTASHSKFTREDLWKYPVGKSRVSVVGILVFSILMSACALYIIIQCVTSLISHEIPEKATLIGMIIMGCTIAIKLTMWITYYCIGHPITKTLSMDHRNDVFTNALGLFMYWGSSAIGWWMDSTGGIILSGFVLVSWVMNALENAKMLMGEAAPPDIIRSLTYMSAHHHPLIKTVEQVIAFQVGPMYFAELHIVVPGNLPLEVAHWIGESLQLKVERMPEIERAFVHVDCESHNDNEHMLFMRAMGKIKSNTAAPQIDEPPVIPEL